MISTPVPSHPPPPPLDQDLDTITITHPGDMITSVTALSLFCPVWQQQRSICLCLNRDNINMELWSYYSADIRNHKSDNDELLAITFPQLVHPDTPDVSQ